MSVVQCRRLPALRSPAMVMAFGGWSDAAEAATTAVSTLDQMWDGRHFASIDPEDFYDFTQVRPRVYFTENMNRAIEWPSSWFSYHRHPKQEHDVVLLRSMEPQLRWRTFSEGIMSFAERLNASCIVSLGALLADVPHTRPVQLTGFGTGFLQGKLRSLGISMSQYEGPTGILGVLYEAATRRGIPAMSLWAAAPHYISTATNPHVSIGLLEGLQQAMGWSLDLSSLRDEARQFTLEVNAIIQANPEASAYVTRLEEAAQSGQPSPGGPPTEVLLTELEEFLRRRRGNDSNAADEPE